MQDVFRRVERVKAIRIPLGAGAVVRQEEDQGVLVLAALLEIGDDVTDRLIHAVDGRGINRHAAREISASVGGQRVPRRVVFIGPTSLHVDEVAGHHASRREREVLRHQTQLFLPVQARLADYIPALGIKRLVFVDFRFGRLQRKMPRLIGQILKPGFAPRLLRLLDEVNRVVGESVGRVELARPVGSARVACGQTGVVGVFLPVGVEAAKHPIELAEAAIYGRALFGEVPFAHHRGAVTGIVQHFGKSDRMRTERRPDVGHARLMGA